MIKKLTAQHVNCMFELKIWEKLHLTCGICSTKFRYEPFVYTYPDGLQSICCSKDCHAFIRQEEKAAAKYGRCPNEP